MIIAVLCGLFKAYAGYAVSDRLDTVSTIGFIAFMAIEMVIEVFILTCCIKYLWDKDK